MKIVDEHGKEPLWHNEQWMIFDDVIQEIKPAAQSSAYWMPRLQIEADQAQTFNHVAKKTWVDPDQLYEAFLQMATYWDLKADFDQLRKIRDEMKEQA